MNTREFVKAHVITISFRPMPKNLNMLDPEWVARHYQVTLRHKGRSLTTSFSKGMGLDYGVEPEEVLDSLASDASSIENATDFKDWARDLGIDAWELPEYVRTKRQAEEYGYEKEWESFQRWQRSYKAGQANTEKLRRFLGPDLFRTLVYNTDRL